MLHIFLQSTIPLPRICKLFLFVCHISLITCVRWSQLDHSPFLYLQISPESLFSRTSNSSPKSWASIFCGISLNYWFQNPNTLENFVNKWLNISFCFSLMFLIVFFSQSWSLSNYAVRSWKISNFDSLNRIYFLEWDIFKHAFTCLPRKIL